MKKISKRVATTLTIILLLLLVVLALGFVPVSFNVMVSLFLVILFILSLIILPQAFERKRRKK